MTIKKVDATLCLFLLPQGGKTQIIPLPVFQFWPYLVEAFWQQVKTRKHLSLIFGIP